MASPNFPLSTQQKTVLKLIDMLPNESKKKKMEYKMALVYIWLWPEKYLNLPVDDPNYTAVIKSATILQSSFVWDESKNHSWSYFNELHGKLSSLGEHTYE